MTKLNTRLTAILALVFAVAITPASIAFAQTTSVDAETSVEASGAANEIDAKTKASMKAKLAVAKEKIQDRNDELKRKIKDVIIQRTDRITDELRPMIRDVVSDVDRRPDLTFRGQTEGWAIVGGVAHKSSLSLAGDAHHIGGGNWKIKTDGDLVVADRNAELDLTGFARGNVIYLQGNGSLDNGETFRIILRGHFAPTTDDNVYAVAFTNAGIHYTNNGIRVPLMLVGSITVIDTTPSIPTPLPAEQQ